MHITLFKESDMQILVIESDADHRRAALDQLVERGHHVTIAEPNDYKTFLDFPYDVVIADQNDFWRVFDYVTNGARCVGLLTHRHSKHGVTFSLNEAKARFIHPPLRDVWGGRDWGRILDELLAD